MKNNNAYDVFRIFINKHQPSFCQAKSGRYFFCSKTICAECLILRECNINFETVRPKFSEDDIIYIKDQYPEYFL